MLSPVRLSIHPSVTRVDQSKTVEVRIMQLSPQLAPSLWFVQCKFNVEILMGSPERRLQTKVGWGQQAIF